MIMQRVYRVHFGNIIDDSIFYLPFFISNEDHLFKIVFIYGFVNIHIENNFLSFSRVEM